MFMYKILNIAKTTKRNNDNALTLDRSPFSNHLVTVFYLVYPP